MSSKTPKQSNRPTEEKYKSYLQFVREQIASKRDVKANHLKGFFTEQPAGNKVELEVDNRLVRPLILLKKQRQLPMKTPGVDFSSERLPHT